MKIIFESDSFSISSTLGKNTPKIDGVFFRNIKEKVLGKKYELSLVFVGTDRMKTLNRRYRQKNHATDILSFGLDQSQDGVSGVDGHGANTPAGEIFINPQKTRTKAKLFDRSFENYLKFLFVHGLVHLKGHDHEDDASAEKMESIEKKIRKDFKI